MTNRILITLLYGIRPLLGPAQCKFEVTCGNYAIAQLTTRSFIPALGTITKRLLLCSPLSFLIPRQPELH